MAKVTRIISATVLLVLALWGVTAESRQRSAPRPIEAPFVRGLPDTAAGAALQKQLGNPCLTRPDREIEREAFELVARDGNELVDDYLGRYGNSVNTDDARELFAAYRADRSRAAAVHAPSTELSARIYARLLDAHRGKIEE
jgi:hypothetical protein